MNNISLNINYKKVQLRINADVRDTGDEIIFFIHGLGCSSESFQEAWGCEKLGGYSLISVDLPGFGDSPGNPSFPCRLEDHAEICGMALENFPGRKIHLVGHSMGGAVSLLLIDIYPGRVLSFANVEGNLFKTDCSVSRSAVESPSFHSFKESLLNRLNYFGMLKTDRGTRLWADWIEKSDPEAFNKSAESLIQWTDSGKLLEKFRELECRKIYICGEKNSHRKILNLIKEIKMISISGSGHFPMNDNPEEFYDKLAEFIQKQ